MESRPYWDLHLSHVDSTNVLGKFLLANNVSSPVAITATIQTAGRGSHGRQWESSIAGGFYYSLAMSPFNPNDYEGLTVRVAGAVQAVLLELWGIEVDIEWPNDLILSGKKVGGILVETVGGGIPGGGHGIIGIGLNINQKYFSEILRPVAISLFQWDGIERSLIQLKTKITKELLSWL
jgi:BirA family biotin operon repressor/biotin-[acetyl-CoA-carboxylase] ligase